VIEGRERWRVLQYIVEWQKEKEGKKIDYTHPKKAAVLTCLGFVLFR